MPNFDPTNADCFVYVYREGLAAAVGHDLAIEVTDFEIETSQDGIRGQFATDSLRVRHAMEEGQPRPGKLSDKDKKKIEKNIRKDVLETKRFPVINFQSTEVSGSGGAVHVEGVLDLHGVERDIALDGKADDGHTVARVSFDQRDFHIEPYRALLGALKLKPRVEVELRVPFVPEEG